MERNYRIAAHIAIAPAQAGVIVLDTKRGEYWQLNEAGAQVLNGIRGLQTVQEIVDSMCDGVEASRTVVMADVEQLVMEMCRAGFFEG